ncbi:MAG: 4Fe-4S dicluster domain-containing protein [Humidesulfovibrio sp.]
MKMLPTVIANLFAKPATRNYPFFVRENFEHARGELINDIDRCIFCGTCARKCPSQCLAVTKDKAGDKTEGSWTLEFFACVGCGVCVDVCPVNCLSQKTSHRPVATQRAVITLRGTLPERPSKKEMPVE